MRAGGRSSECCAGCKTAAVSRNQVLAITEYQAGEIEPRQFYSEHVKRGVPCILRGFVKNAPTDWTLSRLAERFPDAVVQVLDKRTKKMINVSLREIDEDRRTNFIPQQLLLDQNPVFYDYFRIPKSHSYFPVMGRPSKPVLSFLILGLGAGLNANYHCEEGPNWYMAVSGSKRWTLIEAGIFLVAVPCRAREWHAPVCGVQGR